MTNSNPYRLTADIHGEWRLYTNTIPAGSTPIGTVTRGDDDSDTGALVLIEATDTYVQVNSGEIRRLDQQQIIEALRASESEIQPSEIVLKRVNIMLDAESLQIATQLGGGNISAGIRMALRGKQSWPVEKGVCALSAMEPVNPSKSTREVN
jgi:hypothetical protein